MSEDVKPRQFWFNFKIGPNESISQNQIVYMIKNSKHDFHVIELEPTLQLMDEMAEAIINEAHLDSKEEVLKKYRKFKKGLK